MPTLTNVLSWLVRFAAFVDEQMRQLGQQGLHEPQGWLNHRCLFIGTQRSVVNCEHSDVVRDKELQSCLLV